jgi:uncharacterized protein (TIGR02246 family)
MFAGDVEESSAGQGIFKPFLCVPAFVTHTLCVRSRVCPAIPLMENMMKVYIGWVIVLVNLCAVATADDAGTIRQVMDQQVEAWNKGDLEAFMRGYQHSPKLRFASNNHVSYGYEAALEGYKKGFPTREKMGRLAFTDLDIQLLSRDAALVFGRFTNHMKGEKENPTGLFTLIFRKTDAGWRIIHDHSSDARKK